MSDTSPLFVSALELLSHATEIFAQKNPKKYKFVILHLANSIELILKDLVLDQGMSIYKHPKETIGIWDCFKNLEDKGIEIIERPLIELLIDDRNTIQHRFGYPDEKTVLYYLNKVVGFFDSLLSAHYRVQLSEVLKLYLPQEHLELLGLALDETGQTDEFGYLDELSKISPEFSVASAFRDLENKMIQIVSSSMPEGTEHSRLYSLYQRNYEKLLRKLKDEQVISDSDIAKYHELRSLRNEIIHRGDVRLTKAEIHEKIDFSKELIRKLEDLIASDFRFELDAMPRSLNPSYVRAAQVALDVFQNFNARKDS